MNQFVAETYLENIQYLALGLELVDAGRGTRVASPVEAAIDGIPLPIPVARDPYRTGGLWVRDILPRIARHDSSRHALLYRPGIKDSVDVRFLDRARRFVPRRIRFPLAQLTDPPSYRARRPYLFGGATYDVSERVTGLRALVVRGGAPMRWARVEARLTSQGTPLVGRAQGDDRGEFVLLLSPDTVPMGDLPRPLKVTVTVFGPTAIPTPPIANPTLPSLDPLWDLPLETASAPGADDPVSRGEVLPGGLNPYIASALSTRLVTFSLGRLINFTNPDPLSPNARFVFA